MINPTKKEGISWLQKILFAASIMVSLGMVISVFLMFSDIIVPEWILFLAYCILIILVIIGYHHEIAFKPFTTFEGRRRLINLLFFFAFLFVAMPMIIKVSIVNRSFMNGYVLCSSIIFSTIFSLAFIYKNNNIESKKLIFWIPFTLILGAILGYGFSISLNCSEIIDSKVTYTLPIDSKYIDSGVHKGNAYHIPHFLVQPWQHSNQFGNDFLLSERKYDQYSHWRDIDTGDSVVVTVHPGMLNLSWFEVTGLIKGQ